MASIHARARADSPPLPATSLAIPDSVSPRRTVREEPSAVDEEDVEEGTEAPFEAGVSGAPKLEDSCERRGSVGVAGARAIWPLRELSAVEGDATGAFACCPPGVYTGGSSSRSYSRTR